MVLVLSGCASLPEPAGLPVAYPAPGALSSPTAALQAPIDLDAAGQIAVQQHPAVRAAQAAYSAQQAELQQALRPPNPALSIARARKRSAQGDAIETEWELAWGLHLPLGSWLAAWWGGPERQAWGAQVQAQAQAQWLLQVDQAARQARRAHIQAVSAQTLLAQAEAAWEAAQTAATLAQRLHAVGNFSRLQWLRWEQALAQSQLALAQAQAQAQSAHRQLAVQLGLWRPDEVTQLRKQLPTELPPLPPQPPELTPTEAEALAQRLDLRAAQAGRVAALQRAGLADAQRWLQSLSLGLEASRERGPDSLLRQRQLDLGWELPLLDDGRPRAQALQARAHQAAWELQAAAQTVRAQVRDAEAQLQHAWDRAQAHAQRLLPLAQQVSDERLLRYNGMLASPFDLLQDAQDRMAAQRAALEAQRDYWLAAERARQVRWSPPDADAASPTAAPAPTMGAKPH